MIPDAVKRQGVSSKGRNALEPLRVEDGYHEPHIQSEVKPSSGTASASEPLTLSKGLKRLRRDLRLALRLSAKENHKTSRRQETI
jgi:hypothetical protein